MTKWKFNHFSNQCHLFSATSNIIIADFIKFLFILTIYWVSFSIQHCIGSNNSILFWLSCHYLELNRLEISPNYEQISFLDRPVGIFEIWNEICLSEITTYTLDSVFQGQNVDFGEIGNFTSRPNFDNISKPYSQIFSDSFVHPYFSLIQFVISKCNNQCLFTFFAFDENSITLEYFQFTHLGL